MPYSIDSYKQMILDGNHIISIINEYLEIYNIELKMPFVNNIINKKEFDFDISKLDESFLSKLTDSNQKLFQCYLYYSNKYNIEESKINSGKKINNIGSNKKHYQIDKIMEIIHSLPNVKSIHEYCCGRTFLGKQLSLKSSNIEFIGYDINEKLLQTNKTDIPSGKFIKKDLLNDTINIQNISNELIVCLHGCGTLHRRLIDTIIDHNCYSNINNLNHSEQKSKSNYKGKFIIIPCCYYKHRSKTNYQLKNFNITIPYSLLKMVSLIGENTIDINKQYYQHSLQKIKLNLLYDYIFSNDININNCINQYNNYILENYKKNKYIPILTKYCEKDELTFWNNILSNNEFKIEGVTYEKYKHIIDFQDIQARRILNANIFDKLYILNPLGRLIEILILYDYAITLQLNTNLNVELKTFVPYKNSPKNIAIIGY